MGSRACLTLAILLKTPVYTAEQLERNLKLGVPIHVIREKWIDFIMVRASN